MKAAVALIALGACMHEPRPEVACGDPTFYRIDSIELPEKSGQGVAFGLDLDGDGNVDNAYANVIQVLRQVNPELGSFADAANPRLAGEVTWYVTTRACEDGSTRVGLTPGNSADDEVPITVLVDQVGTYAPITWAHVDDVRGDRLVVAGDHADGAIGFAVPMPATAHAVCEPIASYLTTELAAGTSPEAAKMDTNHDGVVSADEVDASDIGKTLLYPDLDGALSAGLVVHAHRAAL